MPVLEDDTEQDFSYRHGQTRLQVRWFWVHILHTNVGERGRHHLHTFDSSTNTWEVMAWVARDVPPTGGHAMFPKPEELAGFTYCHAFPFRSGLRIMVVALCCIDNTALPSGRMDDLGLVLLEVNHESGLLKAISGMVVKQIDGIRGSNPDYHPQWVVVGGNLLVFLDDFYFLRPVAFDMRRRVWPEFPRSYGCVQPCCLSQ
ncbi:hypothetical protein SELMODRAFT_418128 [Selaginella moellendorffii]|uniref:Uncharacterized protein n=1 Tax=Selaginella moellendorffii TaxID=88036 RepID=D8S4S2_SELML|nr:hypothetical protein SELMODRAFT_418128 [Selaginella moellendorffii]